MLDWSHAWGGYAFFSGVVLLAPVEHARLAELLPPPVTLPARAIERPGLAIFLGEMRGGGSYVADYELPFGARYREVGIMVPHVRHPRSGAPALFSYRMYADSEFAITLGNSMYGLRKERAASDWSDSRFQMLSGNLACFTCSGTIDAAWVRGRLESTTGFQRLCLVFAQPVIGRRESGELVESSFEWSFDRAEVCAFSGEGAFVHDRRREPLRFSSERAAAFAVRGMKFRTTPPRELSR